MEKDNKIPQLLDTDTAVIPISTLRNWVDSLYHLEFFLNHQIRVKDDIEYVIKEIEWNKLYNL